MISDSRAESAVLGAILMDPPSFFKVADTLRETDFCDVNRRKIWSTLCKMARAGDVIDPITVAGRCPEVAMSEVLGLSETLCDPGSVEQYAALLIDSSVRREVEGLGRTFQVAAGDRETTRQALMDDLETEVARIASRGIVGHTRSARDIMVEVGKIAEAGRTETIKTGLTSIDSLLIGFEKQDVIILAARPSVGKTALAVNISLRAALDGKSVMFFSLEMSALSLMRRMASIHCGIPAIKFRSGMFSRDDYARLAEAQDALSSLSLYIDDDSGVSPMAMLSRARQVKSKHGLDLIVIDYLQLAVSGERTSGNTNEEVSRISRGIKAIAKRLDVPVLVLSQLSRAPEKEGREIVLSDLRDSGSIEQDADVVMFLKTKGENETTRLVSVRIAKQRNGPTGGGVLAFDTGTQRFSDGPGGVNNG